MYFVQKDESSITFLEKSLIGRRITLEAAGGNNCISQLSLPIPWKQANSQNKAPQNSLIFFILSPLCIQPPIQRGCPAWEDRAIHPHISTHTLNLSSLLTKYLTHVSTHISLVEASYDHIYFEAEGNYPLFCTLKKKKKTILLNNILSVRDEHISLILHLFRLKMENEGTYHNPRR